MAPSNPGTEDLLSHDPVIRKLMHGKSSEERNAFFSMLGKNSKAHGDVTREYVGHWEADDAEARLTVRDTGPGIPTEDRARATERFVRLEKSRSQPGSGLGLSLAKAVMSFHHGRLELADAEPGLLVSMIFPMIRKPDEAAD